MISDKNLVIVNNSQSDELYNCSKMLYDKKGYPIQNVSGKNNFYGFKLLHHIIEDREKFPFDYAIYIDEDCFVTDFDEIISLLNYMVDNNYDTCGVPDGGVMGIRGHNPISPNMFFSIFNLNKIRNVYNYHEVFNSKYGKDLYIHVPKHLIKTNKIIYDNFEPYYRFYFWMLRKGMKILYLDADDAHKLDLTFDTITTAIKSHNSKVFAYHSWYAREYNSNVLHRDRIKNLAKKCYEIAGITETK